MTKKLNAIECIKEIVRKDCQLDLIDADWTFKAKLLEPRQSDYSVMLTGIPSNSIIIRSDLFADQREFIKGDKGENKRCDYILISEKEDEKSFKYIVVFIEFSISKKDPLELEQQFRGGKCVLEYLRRLASEFWDFQNILSSYSPKFVSIQVLNIGKQKTISDDMRKDKGKQKNCHSSPNNFERVRKSNGATYYFKKLIE